MTSAELMRSVLDLIPETPDQALSTHQIADLLGEPTDNSNLGRINNACNTLRRFGVAACKEVPQLRQGPKRHWYKVESRQ